MVLLFALPALAQSFDGQLFRPTSDGQALLWTEDTHEAPDGYATARALLQYAGAPVRWKAADGHTAVLVSDLVGLDALGALHWKTLRLGADLPLYLFTAGDLAKSEPGIGDFALDLKGTVLPRDVSPVGLALLARLTLPTSSVAVPLGADGLTWEALLAVDRVEGRLTMAANLGTRQVPKVTFQDLVWSDQVFARLGAGYRIADDYGVSAELGAQTNWASRDNPAGTPVELLGGGWYQLTSQFVARGGLSFGLSRSPGAPILRMVAGVSWEPDPNPDQDFDGIPDRDDHCPTEAEDPDGYADDDGCNDRSYSADFTVQGGDETALDATITLDGPDQVVLQPGDRVATLHPGTYQARAEVEGFQTWTGTIEVQPRQGDRFTIQVAPILAHLRVFAYDAAGRPVPAQVRVSGGDPEGANGTDIPLQAGQHSLIITADGYVPGSTAITVQGGEQREISVILTPLLPPVPAPFEPAPPIP